MAALRVAFFGSPDFAVPTLRALAALDPKVATVVHVVTQPDRPRGAGLRVLPTPVRRVADELGLPVLPALKVRTVEFRDAIQSWSLDLAVVIAYGRIITPPVLALPRLGFVNLHASLLPKYRGAAPIHWAIARGESVTGVTLMRVDEGLDSGPILDKREVAIHADDDIVSLHDKLAECGATLMVESIEALAAGRLAALPQDNERATFAPVLKKEDGIVTWDCDPAEIVNRVRAFRVWPGAQTTVAGVAVHILRAEIAADFADVVRGLAPGVIVRASARGEGSLVVAARGGAVAVRELQAAGRRPMTAQQFLVGHRVLPGARVG